LLKVFENIRPAGHS